MNIPLYNQAAEKLGEVAVSDGVFGVTVNPDLLHQVVSAQYANVRQPLAHAKGRGEVRGGGKKPWRQKGTGRARHGSIRSPIWKGGGVTHGPTKEHNFKKKINRKVARQALAMALSAKVRDGRFLVVDNIVLDQPKTRLISVILKNLVGIMSENKSTKMSGSLLLALPHSKRGDSLYRSAKNIANIGIMRTQDLQALRVLSYKYLIMTQESLKVTEKLFSKSRDKFNGDK